MPGYMLIEQRYLSPPLPKGKGIKANGRIIGFLDFMKELREDVFPFHEESHLLVTGLEDVLLFSRPDIEKEAREIHHILQRSAQDFEKRSCPDVQVLFRNPLKRGVHLEVEHPAGKLPVYLIFGSPASDSDKKGNVYYKCPFNLSSVS
jgi:hypothetical protein